MRSAIHAFDGEVRLGHHVYPGVSLEALVDHLLKGCKRLGDATPVAATYPTGLKADAQPIRPIDIATAVNDLFERHGAMPIASDMGDCLFTAMDIAHTAIVAPGYYATMGPGIPFGLGLAAASGRRPLILVGDGAFQMTGWELGNCRRYGWNPVVLVFNNTAWGMLKAFQRTLDTTTSTTGNSPKWPQGWAARECASPPARRSPPPLMRRSAMTVASASSRS